MLHVCELEPRATDILSDSEGRLDWFGLDDLQALKDKIIQSDFLIIERMVKAPGNAHYNCVLEKNGEAYLLKKFE
ncbi:MAG: hypothetical protein ACP5E4_02090 [Candidatus Aenigmatarchaeota archaeon]